VDRLVHVYRFPLDFSDSKEHCLYLCDCSAMVPTWDVLSHMDTSDMLAAEITEKLHFCNHSTAIQSLHGYYVPFASLADRDPVHRLSDFSFSCEAHQVCLIKSSPSVMISCDFGNGKPCEGRTRVFIRTNQQRRYICGSCPGATASTCQAHLGPLSSWIDSREDEDAGIFEAYTFKFNHTSSMGVDEEDVPFKSVSSSPIRLDIFNTAMQNRAKCGRFTLCFLIHTCIHYNTLSLLYNFVTLPLFL
jgi:hypothetical protein